jgi:uncharacterized protein YqgC (DUF456 family)
MEILHTAMVWAGWAVVVALCLGGLALSALSISGTWLVTAAAALAAPLSGDGFPGWGTVAVFAGLSLAVEGIEAVAGAWGITRRGGSRLAAAAALIGGLAGLLAGSLIPIPVVGSLLGMMAGSFVLAFLVESRRRDVDGAVSVAWGAVLARLAVLLLKAAATLGMAAWLLAGRLV